MPRRVVTISIDSEDPHAWAAAGDDCAAAGEHADAARCFDRALFLGADVASAASALCDALEKIGAPELAIDAATALATNDKPRVAWAARALAAKDVDASVSVRLRWAVARHASNDHTLDASRAAIGAVYTRPARRVASLPRFVRTHDVATIDDVFAAMPGARKNDDTALLRRAIRAVAVSSVLGDADEVVADLTGDLAERSATVAALVRAFVARIRPTEAPPTPTPTRHDRRAVESYAVRSRFLRATALKSYDDGSDDDDDGRDDGDDDDGLLPLGAALRAQLAPVRRWPGFAIELLSDRPDATAYEEAAVIENVLAIVLADGDDELIASVVDEALQRTRTHLMFNDARMRLRALGMCARASAFIDDVARSQSALEDISHCFTTATPPAALLTVDANVALGRIATTCALPAAHHALAAVATHAAAHDACGLAGVVAALRFQLGDDAGAVQAIDNGLRIALAPSTPDGVRCDAARAIVGALAVADDATRVSVCRRIAIDVARFTDTSPTSKHFPAHQLLVAESIAAALADRTRDGDSFVRAAARDVRAIRRRIMSDLGGGAGGG